MNYDFDLQMSLFIDNLLNDDEKKEFLNEIELNLESKTKFMQMKDLIHQTNSLQEIQVPEFFHQTLMKHFYENNKKIIKIDFKQYFKYAVAVFIFCIIAIPALNYKLIFNEPESSIDAIKNNQIQNVYESPVPTAKPTNEVKNIQPRIVSSSPVPTLINKNIQSQKVFKTPVATSKIKSQSVSKTPVATILPKLNAIRSIEPKNNSEQPLPSSKPFLGLAKNPTTFSIIPSQVIKTTTIKIHVDNINDFKTNIKQNYVIKNENDNMLNISVANDNYENVMNDLKNKCKILNMSTNEIDISQQIDSINNEISSENENLQFYTNEQIKNPNNTELASKILSTKKLIESFNQALENDETDLQNHIITIIFAP